MNDTPGFARVESRKTCDVLYIATDGQAGITVCKDRQREVLAIARGIPSGTPNRAKLIHARLQEAKLLG